MAQNGILENVEMNARIIRGLLKAKANVFTTNTRPYGSTYFFPRLHFSHLRTFFRAK